MKTVLKKSPFIWSVALMLMLTPVAFNFSSGTLMLSTASAFGGAGGGAGGAGGGAGGAGGGAGGAG
ncbi:MAG: hypothetical protein L3J57_15730, partial [Desulfuromusa sp.]|nr:hypothetical protein [Desulfuromusa sp.]